MGRRGRTLGKEGLDEVQARLASRDLPGVHVSIHPQRRFVLRGAGAGVVQREEPNVFAIGGAPKALDGAERVLSPAVQQLGHLAVGVVDARLALHGCSVQRTPPPRPHPSRG